MFTILCNCIFIDNTMEENFTSIHSKPNAEIHDVPMEILIRPFPLDVNDDKVKSLMETLKNPETETLVPPVDILWIKGRNGMEHSNL